MNAFDRFVSRGIIDAEQRLPLLARVEPRDEQAIAAIVQSSCFARTFDGAVLRVQRGFETSTVVVHARQTWSAIAPPHRPLLAGIILIVAALVHVGLVLWHEQPPSWLWLILPGMAAATGLLLTAFSGRGPREQV